MPCRAPVFSPLTALTPPPPTPPHARTQAHPADVHSGQCALCGQGEAFGTDWISCDMCDCWVHFSCDKRPFLGEAWDCYSCFSLSWFHWQHAPLPAWSIDPPTRRPPSALLQAAHFLHFLVQSARNFCVRAVCVTLDGLLWLHARPHARALYLFHRHSYHLRCTPCFNKNPGHCELQAHILV